MATPLIMLALLVVPYFLLSWAPTFRERPMLRGTLGLTLVFCFTGIGHFIEPNAMADMIPPAVPYRVEAVLLSGVFEFAIALAVLVRRWRRAIGIVIILLLIALLPFNIYAAVERVPMGGHAWGPSYLLIRVPLQAVLIAWTYWFTVRGTRENHVC